MNAQTTDFSTMNKGDSIHREHVEAIVGVTVESAEYSLKAMQLADRIEKDLARAGKPATVATRHGDIKVLLDPEAVDHNIREFRRGYRKMVKSNGRMAAVDTSNLSRQEQERHDRALQLQGAMLAAVETARQAARRERLLAGA